MRGFCFVGLGLYVIKREETGVQSLERLVGKFETVG